MKQKHFFFALVAMLLSFVSPAFAKNVAKVGNTEYATIDEAIANWTNGTTLTLLADVTLSDVIKLSSTEYHILDLGTYTMTAPDANGTVATKVEVATLDELQAALASTTNVPIVITAQIEIPEGETVELDLNGKTVNSVFNGSSTTNHIYALSNKGTLTIKDSNGEGSINSRGIYNYGSLTLNAGAINAIDGNGGYAVNNQSGSTFVMNGGVVAATNEDDHQSDSGGYDATALKVPAGCTATLNGGTINNVCDFTYAIDAAGTLNIPETSTITVNGTHGAIYVSGGVTTINAGTFQIPADNYSRTDNVLYVSGGSLVVNGGTFIGDSDTASGGSCLCDTKGTAVVNGGTFKGSSGGDVWGTTGTTIKGGTFENLTEKQHIAAGYELNADGTVAAKPVAEVNGVKYASFAEAAAAAQTGNEIKLLANIEGDITVPANVTLNGNGFAVSGTITADGEITFAGVTKTGNFGVKNVNTVVNIPAGASLQLTGTGRMVIGHGCTFNITGTITDAKTADKATLVPSLKIAAGASITGNGVTFNVNNAYIVANANTTSKNSNANGTLDFNINNSIWDQTGVLAFYVPTSGKDPVVNFELKNSVLTTTSHLVFGVSRGEVVIDNSKVNEGVNRQLENLSTMTIKNGSVVNGAVATSSNAKNPGTIIVENATYAVTGEFSGSDLGTGTLIIKKGANVSAGSITKANITIDATDMVAGDAVNLTANLANLAGTLSVINNDKLEAKIVDGKIVLAAKPVAKIGEQGYATLGEAVAALKSNETLVITSDITPGANEFIELNGKTNVTLAAAEGVVIKGNIQVGHHPSHTDNDVDRSESTFTVNGLTVEGTLTVCSNDAALVVKNTKAAQITVKTNREGMDIDLNNNTADGDLGTATNSYGMFLVPNATGYDLKVDRNTFKNINSHAFVVQGCGDGSAVTAANSIVVTNNKFESWGTGGKDNRAAFKIWADTKYAPAESDLAGTTNAMRELVDAIAAGGNTYSSTADNTVEFDAYGAAGDAEDFPAPMYAVAKIGEQGYATIKDAVAAVKESETITILAGTHSEGTIMLPATLKNVTIKGAEGAELKDMTISAADGNAYSYVGLTFDGITFDNSRILLTGWRNGDETIENLAVTNCTFKNLDDNTNTAPVHINKDATKAVKNFTFTNNVIDGATGGSKSGIYAQVTGEVKVENNIINNVSFRPYVIQVTTDDGIADNFTVKGNTFSGSAAGRAQGLGNNAEGTDNVNLVVSNNIFKGITEAQQICYWNFNSETTTADLSKNYYDIDIVANPSKIYFNSAAADNYALRDMNVFPIYTALNDNGTINTESAFTPKFYIAKVGENSYESLSEALEAATEGATVTLLNNTTESIAAFNNVKLATAVAGGVTVKNTYGDWIDMTSVAIGTGVTLDMKNVFYKGGENVIEGMLNAATLYNGYDAKTTVQNGGKIATTGMIVNRYHTAADAGIYVYGDGDASTVEVSCANTIGTYSGTFYTKDAVVNGDMLWIDYLKGSTQEADNYSQSKPVFENSTVNITKELRLYKDATLTLVNSDVTAGTVQIRENATPTVNVDANSTVKATSVQNLTGASMDAVLDENGFVSFNSIVAKIGTVKYTSLEAAFKAATSGCTIDILSDVTVDKNWDARYTGGKFTVPVTINGNGKTIKFTASVNDNNYQAPFRFEADATVKNLTIDMSEVTDNRFRAISSKGNLTVDNSKFIGKDETLNCRAIIFGEGAGANVGNLAISITNSKFINWKRGITDNENAQDVKTVTITGNTMTDAGVGVSAKETVTFTGNTVAGAYVNIKSYTAGNKLAVTATGNTLEANTDESGKFNVIDAGGVVNAEGFKVVAKGNNFNGYTGTDGIWGEVWGNARESFVIKVLDANDNVMGTTSLNNVGGIIDGDVNVSWNLKFNAAANTDEYWTMEWTTAPTLNNMPAKVELWVDGTRVGGGPVVLNGPDDLNKINVIVTDADGKITSCQTTVANALAAAKDGETVNLLWKDGQAPLAMNGAVFGKNVTIAGTAKVDWNKGFLFVGRGGAGNATVTFDGANLTSASNSSSYGIHVSGREKNTTNKYDGTLVIKNSTIELDYLINRNAIELDNATLTVKNGFAIAGRPASETENAANATATISLANGSKVVVNNHNGMGLGQAASVLEGFGVMNVDATSAFETTQGFVVTVNGTMNIAGNATIAGTLTNDGAINLASENATLKAQAGLTINSTVEGRDVIYADGVYTTKLGLKGKGTEAEPYLIYNVKELVAFRNSVNEGETKYSAPGVYVALGADIDMAGENWVGIGSATADHGFMGNFDGQGYKIMNLTITNPALDSDGYAYAGLFGVTEGTDKNNQNTIKNLTIENVTINTTGDIVSAAIAYPYYTIVDNVKVCGNIAITGGNYTAGVLAYTRRCVNASNLSIVGNDGSFVKGNQTVGGVISDIQMNGGLTAVYSNFSAQGITVTGEKSVGGISGIIATQTLNGATVKNVTLNSTDEFAGVVAGRLGGTSTISNVVSENVTGATAVIGATFDGAKAVAAKIGDTYYATLEAALAAQGNEVELLATYEVAAGETKTLDLKGKTVIGTPVEAKAYAVIINKGNLTITGNGSVICNHTLAGSTGYAVNTITNGGTLTIDGATIENKSTAQYQIGYAIDNNSTTGDAIINIKAGKVIASGSSYYDGIRLFCNSMTKKNDVIVSGGEVSTIWMQNPSDGAEKNTKDVAGNVEISGGKVGVLSLEPSANFEAAVTGGHINEISYFQTAEGRDLVQFVTGGTFNTDVNQFCALGYQAKANAEGLYAVEYTGEVAEFTIVDGQYTDFNIETPITVGTLTYKRNSLDVLKWNALYVPFDIPVSAFGDDYKVAYINDMHSSDANKNGIIDEDELTSLTMEGVYITNGTLRANHPYVIIPQNEEAKDLELVLNNVKVCTKDSITVDFSSAYIQYYVRGTYVKAGKAELNEGGDFFALNKGVWMKASETAKLGAFRIYFTMENKDGSPVVISDDAQIRVRIAGEEDQVTGIFTPYVENDVHFKKGIFDLMGRPVVTPEKGKIYIIDGKKRLY